MQHTFAYAQAVADTEGVPETISNELLGRVGAKVLIQMVKDKSVLLKTDIEHLMQTYQYSKNLPSKHIESGIAGFCAQRVYDNINIFWALSRERLKGVIGSNIQEDYLREYWPWNLYRDVNLAYLRVNEDKKEIAKLINKLKTGTPLKTILRELPAGRTDDEQAKFIKSVTSGSDGAREEDIAVAFTLRHPLPPYESADSYAKFYHFISHIKIPDVVPNIEWMIPIEPKPFLDRLDELLRKAQDADKLDAVRRVMVQRSMAYWLEEIESVLMGWPARGLIGAVLPPVRKPSLSLTRTPLASVRLPPIDRSGQSLSSRLGSFFFGGPKR